MQPTVLQLTSGYADIWIATDHQSDVDYSYGGTRMVDPDMADSDVHQLLDRLMVSESQLKNQLINKALRQQSLGETIAQRTPDGFLGSSVGGARCLIRPTSAELRTILNQPTHPQFAETIAVIFEQIGAALNQQEGRIKLTPDFGRFAGMADLLAQFTPHVLGIRCEAGGCGGKSSYSATGIIAALETLGVTPATHPTITLIGADGAMGSHVLDYCLDAGFADIAVCDLAYDNGTPPPALPTRLAARDRAFTAACLERGGVIVATTVGHELEHSSWQAIPANSILLLAHNLAIPAGSAGELLMQQLADQGVCALPGQLLTLGGALTSRVEWFWRQSRPDEMFDKLLAHTIVRAVVEFLVAETLKLSHTRGVTPYEAMLHMTQDTPVQA